MTGRHAPPRRRNEEHVYDDVANLTREALGRPVERRRSVRLTDEDLYRGDRAATPTPGPGPGRRCCRT
jgi:hypothetical protein